MGHLAEGNRLPGWSSPQTQTRDRLTPALPGNGELNYITTRSKRVSRSITRNHRDEHLLSARSGQERSRRSLPDIDLSTTAYDGQASALFSATKNPHRIPVNTPPVFRGLWSRIYLPLLPLLPLVTNGNVGQAPGQLNIPSSARSWRVSLTRIRVGLKMALCIRLRQPRPSACPSSWEEWPSRSAVSQSPRRLRHHRSIGARIEKPINNILQPKGQGVCR